MCECSLTAGNYLLSYTNINCGDAPEARDGYFTTYYAFNKIVLDDTSSLQKCTALKNQTMAGIQLNSPSLLKHIALYEKALGVGISVISAWGGNKRVYQPNPQYTMQIILYHIHSDMNDWGLMPSLHTLMHYWERVITVLAVTWPLTIAAVTVVKCGATYVDGMDVWWKLDHLQLCVIHAMLLAIPLNA